MDLKMPLRKSKKSISFMGSSIFNKLSNQLKFLDTITSCTQNYKRLVLKN